MLTDEIKFCLTPLKESTTLFITIGNSFRSDDGVGPYLFKKLKSKKNTLFKIINAGISPENILEEAIKINPKKTIIFDASNFNGNPGEIRLIPEEKIPVSTLSTHTFPPVIISKLLKMDTKSEVCFIGIQIKKITIGTKISKEIKKSANEIVEFISSNV